MKTSFRRWSSFPLLPIGLLLFGLFGCGPADEAPKSEKLQVMVTILPQLEFAQQVGGERIEATVLIPPGAEPHTYEPTPSQLRAISTADLYAQVGSGIHFEHVWMSKIRSLNQNMRIVDCAAGIEVLDGDPHIWLSPRRARVMAANICAGLIAVDPASQEYYQQNRDRYLQELDELDAHLEKALEKVPLKTFMVYHPSWGYFARDYGLEQLAIEAEGKEPTARHLMQLVRQARQQGVELLFVSPQFDTRSAEAIGAETGARIIAVDPLPYNYRAELERFAAQLSSP